MATLRNKLRGTVNVWLHKLSTQINQ